MAERSGASSSNRNKSRKRRPVCAADAGPLTAEDSQAGEQQLSFEVELAWCIQQLELALHKDVSEKQSGEAVRVLKVLKNPKAALVKKRHAMRTTFGDYRKKMKEEEKMFASSAKNITLQPAAKKKQDKSSFLRKCVSHMPVDTMRPPVTSERPSMTFERPPVTSSLTPEEVPSESAAQMEKAQQFIDNKAACFKFNLSVSDSVTEMPTDSSASDNGASGSYCVGSDTLAQSDRNTEATDDCYAFKMLPSDNNFKFNFTTVQGDNVLENYKT